MFSGQPSHFDDATLVRRIRTAYSKAVEVFAGYGASQWAEYHRHSRHIHEALLAGPDEAVAAFLRDPAENNLLYGFDTIYAHRAAEILSRPDLSAWETSLVGSAISRLSIAVGATTAPNPEHTGSSTSCRLTDAEKLLGCCSSLPFPLSFPNPYRDEFGLEINGEIASVRAVLAVYQAYKTCVVKGLTSTQSVLEIGGGLGRAAYYCHFAGMTSYSIVDLPLTGAAQAYFLGRVLGDDKVSLYGEEPRQGAIRLLPPAAIGEAGCDLVVNVDSFTEMDPTVAGAYIDHAMSHSKALFSINHEVNAFTVNEIIRSRRPEAKVLRNGSPVRAGYMEEIVFIR